ncbi:Succinyl-CoA:3-ketoacid-coenzyme A transferase 2,mitochondrial [Wickerhamomyces ciferrii]|uniref:Succinyl-CoA:3-ketoacid-coenzyme A transferase n=1 Tax=Wickerhamomyces ciferrii (strain ATCC 14091 / BCRC 22168 / CBS 111 / JCM 3599 / NBRC 0793 / NRRL Y-1031 F-60-10) TaxID=1206466 RepID=K0KPY9_WICCF|nr:Succinyl-CoA:3-ketoacid-coenzyme A transferase 2,mitochondrial [Wickerhamomyces ciferrii]CCH43499.1 Succinyl-CoA:3-ketoacid-coenzyme A transferase 2,mitochondrial [Wickerhamomyces ciferrii]
MMFKFAARTTVRIGIRFSSTYPSSSKIVKSADEAINGIKSGDMILSGGFGLSGVSETLIDALSKRPDIKNLTAVSNNAGLEGKGLSKLLESGQVTKMIASYIGMNKKFEQLYLNGSIDLELTPQGTIIEKVRSGAAGIPAFYTPTGVGTWVQEGKLPVRYDSNGKVLKTSKPKESRRFNGRDFLLEESIYGDVAFVKAFKVDTLGNCWFRGSSRNFNQAFGKNAKLTIVEAENIVEPGEIEPENVHLQSIFVDKIVQSIKPKQFEVIKFAEDQKSPEELLESGNEKEIKRYKIAKRASQEFEGHNSANLGVGLPNLSAAFLPEGSNVLLESENGILGMGQHPKKGKEDADYVNSGKETVTLVKGASLFGSEDSFGMIRGGNIGLTMLGAFQVSANGDLANWGIPGKIKGMGGAMDLVSNPKATKVVVVTEHTNKKGVSKIVENCEFPLTGEKVINTIITELAVFIIKDGKLVLTEISTESSLEEVQKKTNAKFIVSDDLKEF